MQKSSREGRLRGRGGAWLLLALFSLGGCFGLRLTVAPTVDTERNLGVEARLSVELDTIRFHVGAGGGGGRVAGGGAGAWHVNLGTAIPVARDLDHLLDLDLAYSGYYVSALSAQMPPASPYAHGVRGSVLYRRMVANLSKRDAMAFSLGAGFFGEAVFPQTGALGVFGLPFVLHFLYGSSMGNG